MKAKSGLFQSEINEQLIEEANINPPDYQKYVCLVFDEVKIKQGLVYDKEASCLIGFVILTTISEHMITSN